MRSASSLLGALALSVTTLGAQSLLDRLDTTSVELRFANARLDDWVARLRAAANLEIDVDPRLQREAEATTTLVEFRYTGAVSAALDLIASIRPIHWEARGGRIRLYPAAAEAEQRAVLIPYPLAPAQAAGATDEQIVIFLRRYVAPWSWTPENNVETQRRTLMIRQSMFVHERVRHALSRLHDSVVDARETFDEELTTIRRQLLALQRSGTIERLDHLTLMGTGVREPNALGQIARRLRATDDAAALELARFIEDVGQRARTTLALLGCGDGVREARLPKLALQANADFASAARVLSLAGNLSILTTLSAERWLSGHRLGRSFAIEPDARFDAVLAELVARSGGQLEYSLEHDAVVLRLRR